jgi:hypothetical protein
MLRNSQAAAQLVTPQEGFITMELISLHFIDVCNKIEGGSGDN